MSTLSLNGNWNYIIDPHNELSHEELLANRKFPESNKMIIPTNWEKADLNNYSGVVWFSKTFNLPKKRVPNRISTLKFFGVDYYTQVWLNGFYVGEHEGYFQSFDFDVTEFLKFGKINQISVKANSPKEEPGKVWPLNKQLINCLLRHILSC